MRNSRFVEESARGMLRNFGDAAAEKADALQKKFSHSHPTAAALWGEIAQAIQQFPRGHKNSDGPS